MGDSVWKSLGVPHIMGDSVGRRPGVPYTMGNSMGQSPGVPHIMGLYLRVSASKGQLWTEERRPQVSSPQATCNI